MKPLKIETQSLTVRFPTALLHEQITAVENLSLDIQDGEFVCMVGPSGCGKTTLLRVVAGLENATEGTVLIHRKENRRPSHAMVFQDAGLFPWMTVLENTAYGMRIQGVRGKRRYEIAQAWLEKVGLTKFMDAFPKQLSGGMRQRVGLARAFAHNPEILLMDEPFGALDAQTRILLQEELLQLWKDSDITVVFVTHSIEEALILADRIVVMSARPGRILGTFPVQFSRPRDVMALRTHPDFGAQYLQIWSILKEQVHLA